MAKEKEPTVDQAPAPEQATEQQAPAGEQAEVTERATQEQQPTVERVSVRMKCILSGLDQVVNAGDVIELDADEAARLIELGDAEAVKPAAPSETDPE